MSYCWGVIQSVLVDEGLSSPATLAFVGSLAVAAVSFYALVNAWIYRRLGARTTGMVGVSLVGLAEILNSFTVNTVAGLFITAGILQGFGLSLCFITIGATPAQYFSRKRGIANGIIFAGGGLGGAIISFTLDYMIKDLGISSTYRILGLLTLGTGLPAAWFVKERVPSRAIRFVDWYVTNPGLPALALISSRSLFKDVKFLVIFISGAIATFPLLVPPFFLPQYSQSLGLSSATGAGVLAGFNFASAVGRIAAGFLCDTIGSLNTLLIVILLNALSMLVIWPVSAALGPLILFAIINGAANGGFFSTMPTVAGNVFGSQRVSVALGMIVSAWAGGYLMVYVHLSAIPRLLIFSLGLADRRLSLAGVRRY